MTQAAASRSICARFAAAARTYHDESSLQRTVAEKLAASMLPMEQIDCVLEIGCGTGFLTELLRLRFPGALIHAVDIARPMIDMAKERIGECGRIRWHVSDARLFHPDRDFPLIISSSALHWMTPVSETIKRLGSMLEPGGNLVSALMVKGTFEELHTAREYLFPNKTAQACLPPAEEILEAIAAAGLKIDSSRQEVLRERYDSACGFLRSLNRQGVTAVANNGCSLLNRTELRKLIGYYDQRFAAPAGGVFATHRILYVKARKASRERSP
ncbi:MAG: methyltransferase domain-containing protein [Syntrophobacteraceae bacterium]|jgi:malonyl-CoA O-methyltransferase